MAEEAEALSYMEMAFDRSALPRPKSDPFQENPLGASDFDWFIFEQLANAGISVEMVREAADESLYESVQIVDEIDQRELLKIRDEFMLNLASPTDMHGLQVNLNGAHKWKVTIANENFSQHSPPSRRAGRARGTTVAETKSTTISNANIYEVAVPVPEAGMRCTAALARNIIITIAFKRVETRTTSGRGDYEEAIWDENNKLPMVAQRRIDIVFLNQYASSVQVCVLEHE